MPDLRPLLWPRAIALIGASDNKEIIRGRLLHIMQFARLPGKIFPVTPSRAEVQGLTAYPSVAACPEPVDLAIIVIPAAAVAEVLDECGARGIKAAVVISSGFGEEKGEAARVRQEELQRIAERHGMAICGPNCEGVANALMPMAATFSPSLETEAYRLIPEVAHGAPHQRHRPERGAELLLPQSRRAPAAALHLHHQLRQRGDARRARLRRLDARRGAHGHLPHVHGGGAKRRRRSGEWGRRPRGWASPSSWARSGARRRGGAPRPRTPGALAGSDSAYDAHVPTLRDRALRGHRRDGGHGGGLRLLPASPGPAGGAAERVWRRRSLDGRHVRRAGPRAAGDGRATRKEIDPLIPSFASSQNPIDLTAQAIREVGYARIIEILQRSAVTDMIVVVGSLATETMLRRDIDAASTRVARDERGAHRLLRLHQRLAGGDHPAGRRRDSRPTRAWRTAPRPCAALAEYAEFQRRWRAANEPGRTPSASAAEVGRRLREAGRVLCEYEAKDVLARLRCALVRARRWPVTAEGVEARGSDRLPRRPQSPVARHPHKTEAGAVALGLGHADGPAAGVSPGGAPPRGRHPGADIRGVLVQQMAPAGCGDHRGCHARRDLRAPAHGGAGRGLRGGAARRGLRPGAARTREDARDLLGQLRGARLLARGAGRRRRPMWAR